MVDAVPQSPYSCTPVLVAFNPLERARNLPIEKWEGRTFAEVVQQVFPQLEKTPVEHALVVNPVVGPECLTGSTRMKGGSATKIILESAFGAALACMRQTREGGSGSTPSGAACSTAAAAPLHLQEELQEWVQRFNLGFLLATQSLYSTHREVVARLVDLAGDTLAQDGRICYVGANS